MAERRAKQFVFDHETQSAREHALKLAAFTDAQLLECLCPGSDMRKAVEIDDEGREYLFRYIRARYRIARELERRGAL